MARHLLVTNDYLPKTGGIQVYLHELWRRLEENSAVVLTAKSHDDWAAFDARAEVVVERIDSATLIMPTVRVVRAIEAAIARHRPDFVLLDPAWPLGIVGPRLSVPYGVILHGAEVTIPGRLPLIASSLRYVLRHATVAVAAGGYPAAQARRVAGPDCPPIIHVPPGVDTQRFTPLDVAARQRTREAMDIPRDALLVSSYSRLVSRKGMDTLIAASARLRDEFPNLLVTIGGAGRDRVRLEKLATARRAPVRFLGRVDDALLPDWVASSDLMVMDCRSRWFGLEQEGFGIVFLEAAATGVAQIAGRSGGSHEAVRHNDTGLIVERPRSVDELTSAMRDVLGDAARREAMGKRSREVAEREFDWSILAHQLAAGLSQVTPRSSTS